MIKKVVGILLIISMVRGISFSLSTSEIAKLKDSGVSDQTIQKMIEREEREKAKYRGITRIQQREDGKEVIIYGSVDPLPPPTTKQYHFNTDATYLRSLFLNIANDECITPEEHKAWDLIKGLRLYKEIE